LNCLVQDPGYTRLKDRLIASTGLAFYADRDIQLSELINRRLSALGTGDCASYARFLYGGGAGSAEMDFLIADLTVGETYFFRDEDQFAAIRDVALADILERKQSTRQLRIWSAGCATGAEAYSLAIMLADDLAGRIAGWDIRIYATDLNRDVLARAADGKFRAWALRSTPEHIKSKCFSREGHIWTIRNRYRQWISFHQMNLVERQFSEQFAAVSTEFDLILCRNVMIYFAPEMSRLLIERFHQRLGNGGWLGVGASEYNLGIFESFRTVKTRGAMLLQKIALPCALAEVPPERRAEPPISAVRADQPRNEPGLEDLRKLADRGEWQRAAEYGLLLAARDRLNPSIHFYQALVFDNLGNPVETERSLRQAIYLDRNFALAHYHLGLALKRDRRTDAAANSFGNVVKVLTGIPGHMIVRAGSGITAAELKKLARMHLEGSGSS